VVLHHSIPRRLSATPVRKYRLTGTLALHPEVWYVAMDWKGPIPRPGLRMRFWEYAIAHYTGVASGVVPSGKNILKATPVILKYW